MCIPSECSVTTIFFECGLGKVISSDHSKRGISMADSPTAERNRHVPLAVRMPPSVNLPFGEPDLSSHMSTPAPAASYIREDHPTPTSTNIKASFKMHLLQFETRRPEKPWDKFADEHGQKGIFGQSMWWCYDETERS